MIFIEKFNGDILPFNGILKMKNDKVNNFVFLHLDTNEQIIFKYKKTGQSDGDYFVDIVYRNKNYKFTENEEDTLAIKQIEDLKKWISNRIEEFCISNSVHSNKFGVSGGLGAVANINYSVSNGEVPASNCYIKLSDYKGELPKEYI